MIQVAKRNTVLVAAACGTGSLSAGAEATENQATPASSSGHAQNVAFKDLKWQ